MPGGVSGVRLRSCEWRPGPRTATAKPGTSGRGGRILYHGASAMRGPMICRTQNHSKRNQKFSGQLNILNCFRSETSGLFFKKQVPGRRLQVSLTTAYGSYGIAIPPERWEDGCFGALVLRFASAFSRSPELFPVAMVKLENQQSFLQQTLDSALVGTGWGK